MGLWAFLSARLGSNKRLAVCIQKYSPTSRRNPMTDAFRALAGIALGMVSILCLYAFMEKLK